MATIDFQKVQPLSAAEIEAIEAKEGPLELFDLRRFEQGSWNYKGDVLGASAWLHKYCTRLDPSNLSQYDGMNNQTPFYFHGIIVDKPTCSKEQRLNLALIEFLTDKERVWVYQEDRNNPPSPLVHCVNRSIPSVRIREFATHFSRGEQISVYGPLAIESSPKKIILDIACIDYHNPHAWEGWIVFPYGIIREHFEE